MAVSSSFVIVRATFVPLGEEGGARNHLGKLVPQLHSFCEICVMSTVFRRLKGHGERERYRDWKTSMCVATCIGERKQTFVVLEFIPHRYALRSSRRNRGKGAEVLGIQNSMSVAGRPNLQKGVKDTPGFG